MRYFKLLQTIIMVTLVTLIMVGCVASEAAPTAGPPANTSTAVPPTNTPTAIPPTNTPTAILPTATATSLDGTWTARTDMPTPRWEYFTSVVDGKIYVIGGAGPIYEALGTVEVYDPATDTWETKSPMPTARQGLSTSVVDGKIYAIGGGATPAFGYWEVETFSTVEEYDPATDTWTTKSPMPTARGWHSANVVEGKIYILGGSQGTGPWNLYSLVLTVEVYDPATDTWSQKGDMPISRGAGASSVVDGKIYFFGGDGAELRVDEYDPSTDTWAEKSEMPKTRIDLSTSVLDGMIYLIGGFRQHDFTGISTIDVYDPATDTWTTAPDMLTGRLGAYTAVMDGKIYVFGGMTFYPSNAKGIVEVYAPK